MEVNLTGHTSLRTQQRELLREWSNQFLYLVVMLLWTIGLVQFLSVRSFYKTIGFLWWGRRGKTTFHLLLLTSSRFLLEARFSVSTVTAHWFPTKQGKTSKLCYYHQCQHGPKGVCTNSLNFQRSSDPLRREMWLQGGVMPVIGGRIVHLKRGVVCVSF